MDYTAQGLQHLVRVQVLDRTTRAATLVDGVKSVSIDQNQNRTLRGGGSLTVDLRQRIEWRKMLVRVWVVLKHRGQVETHPVLTAVPTVSDSSRGTGVTSIQVVLQDLTSLLDDPIGVWLVHETGAVVTTVVRAILATRGLTDVQVTDSPLTLRSDITWEPTDTWRRVINDLLDTINYGAIWTNPRGAFMVQPYVLPSERAELFSLVPGPRAIHKDTLDVSVDERVPNHFLLTTQPDDWGDVLIAEGWNNDPLNPWSTVNQGVVPDDPREVEAADQATLDAQLARIMAEYLWRPRKFIVEWRWFPVKPDRPLLLADAGRLRAIGYQSSGVEVADPADTKVTLEEFSWSWSSGQPLSHVKGTLKEVQA